MVRQAHHEKARLYNCRTQMKNQNSLKLIFVLLFLSIPLTANQFPYTAICIAPVADVISEPIENFELSTNALDAYACMPASWEPCEKNRRLCPRVHQLLFHETVKELSERDQEVCIQVPHCSYRHEQIP